MTDPPREGVRTLAALVAFPELGELEEDVVGVHGGDDESGRAVTHPSTQDIVSEAIRAVRANIERLKAENPEGGLVIQADRESKNGILVNVMDAAMQAGVKDVSIAARPVRE